MMTACIFILGLCIGSFLNVVIYRLPKLYSLSLPARSVTPCCGRKIPWFQNIPLLSFLALRGHCGFCQKRIHWVYPFVELLTALLWIAVWNKLRFFSWELAYFLIFVSLCIPILFIDLEHRIIPNELSYFGLCVGLAGSGFIPGFSIQESLFGALLGGGFFGLTAYAYEKFTHREGLGWGDVKLIAMIGAFLGKMGVVFTILASSLLGSAFGLVLMIRYKKDLKLALPYGPFLVLAALFYLFWGNPLENAWQLEL